MPEHPFAVLLSILGRSGGDPICICHKAETGPMGYVWTTASAAPAVASRYEGTEHVWFGVQPMAPPLGSGRGGSRDVLGLRALYADLDYCAEGKVGGMLPETAMDIIEALSVIIGGGPAAIVASGYGVQPYFVLDAECSVVEGSLLLARWRALVMNVAKAHGATVDSGVYDLARILRVPGPPNLKRGGSARTGLIVPRPSSFLSLSAVNMALDAYAPVTDSLRSVHSSNLSRLSGLVPASSHPGDRVFTDAEALDFITEFALSRVSSCPWGSGADFWKVIWEASMTCSNFVEMFDEDDLKDMLRQAVASGHSGACTDAADEYQIAMGFLKGREWLARRPSPAEISDPFNAHCTLPGTLISEPSMDDVPGADGSAPAWFSKASLNAVVCAEHLRALVPVALTRETGVAVYANGVYRIDDAALRVVTIGMLGNRWNTSHHNTIEAVVAAQLYGERRQLSERMIEPLVNFTNGMLDLRTLELRPHDPAYVSTFQLPFDWEPTAVCPTYLRWVAMINITDQLIDLEETVGSMFDPSRTPTKALFVFGPARSGKSTYLRLMGAAIGPEKTSGLSLQDLAEDRFAAANLYGMVLNLCADLSAAHVEDVSLFKKLTGQDLIAANRKYGRQFTFTNSALFAFSGNTLPTVSESSRAYLERMKPISFATSFAGAEDPSIEDAMMTELPGIVARWVRAYRDRLVRGTATPTLPRVAAQFAEASSRVSMWLATEVDAGEGYWSTTTALYDSFKRWCDQEGGAKAMGRTKFAEQLRAAGVDSATNSATKARGWAAYPKLFS